MQPGSTTFFVLLHVHELPTGGEDTKLIGIYSSMRAAEDARARLRTQPGFVDAPEDFEIYEYEVDKDHWTDGYFTYFYNEN